MSANPWELKIAAWFRTNTGTVPARKEFYELLEMIGERDLAELRAENERLRTALAGIQETYSPMFSPALHNMIDEAMAENEPTDAR